MSRDDVCMGKRIRWTAERIPSSIYDFSSSYVYFWDVQFTSQDRSVASCNQNQYLRRQIQHRSTKDRKLL